MASSGRALASACGSTIQRWEPRGASFSATDIEQPAHVTSVAFAHSNSVLFCGRNDGRVALHLALPGGRSSSVDLEAAPDGEPMGQINSVAVSPCDTRLAVGCRNGTVHIWSLQQRVPPPPQTERKKKLRDKKRTTIIEILI